MKKSISIHKNILGSLLILVIIALIPLFVHSPYYLDLFIMIIVNSILAMTFVMLLRAGLIHLGLAAFWGVGAYASATLTAKFNFSFWLSLPLSAVITAFIALIIGLFLIGSGSAGFSFVVLSSVIGMLFVALVGNIPFLGGHTGIFRIPPPDPISIPFLPSIDFTSKEPFFYLALVLLIIVILVIKAFYSSWTGRAWEAIGLNPRLAQSIGIDIFRYKLLVFTVACGLAGLVGSFYANYQASVIPPTYDMFTNIYIQIYAILGGIGYPITGPIVGSIIMTFLPELFRFIKEFSPIFTGVILIFLIMFLPTGLLSLWEKRNGVIERFGYIRGKFESALARFRGRCLS